MYHKDFDQWNTLKKVMEATPNESNLFFHEREIWWASLGLNLGNEQDGKNINYERPVVIMKKFNTGALWIVPLTSRDNKKENTYYFRLTERFDENTDSVAILSQIRLISSKRLLRKVGHVSKDDFTKMVESIKNFFPNVN